MEHVAVIIAEEGDMDSWKRAKDKTHIINKTRDMIRNQHNQRVSQARDQANNSQEKIETYRRELTSHHRKLADAMKLIEDSEGAFDEKANKLIADMELLAQFDRVTDLRVEGEWIHIHTDRIIITDPESGNQYIGGEFIIKVRMQDSKVTFHSANGSGHRGYWTSNDPHPHVNGSDGVACLGSVSSTIAELCSQEQIYALGIVLISFLEAVNVNDSAGRKVENWRRYHGEGTDTSTEAESLFDTDDEEESAE
jgi:phosphatidate phosphatase PAH1